MYKLTTVQIDAFREAFSMFDEDDEGFISTEDLGTLLSSLGQFTTEAELQDIINEVDYDCSGTIDFYEFMTIMARKIDLREAYRVFVTVGDRDGFISVAELRVILTSFREGLTDEEVDYVMREIHIHGDGLINIEELVIIMLGMRAAGWCVDKADYLKLGAGA